MSAMPPFAEPVVERCETEHAQFIRVLGHDLRNVMGAVTVAAEVLRASAVNDVEKNALQVLLRQITRLDQVTGTALEVARAIDGHAALSLRRVTLQVLVEQLFTSAHLEWVAEAPSFLQETWVEVDLPYFLSAMRMLVNALREELIAAESARVAWLEILHEGDRVILRFGTSTYTAQPSVDVAKHRRRRSRDLSGQGLDVFWARKMLQLQGGTLQHIFRLGSGSEFMLTLRC